VRIESVTAVEFGPFRDVTLEFAPQLTVIYGPNEAGKSSWHAAIYAALCGMRRGRGQPRLEDRHFAARHRPWNGDDWEVRTLLSLDDGRRVELRQNLSDLAHCSAQDADLGRDVSGEILNDGTPDAATWLGLDRQTFLSVACVRQAEIRAVVDDATSLQDQLQRAAASAARDATAAEAIQRLEDFQKEHIGQDRANSTKPLQRANVRLAASETALADAQQKHAIWLTVETQALKLRKTADEAERQQRMFRALRARMEAESWSARLERARGLAAKYPEGPPVPLSDDETLAGDVAAALSEWENRPEVPVLTGPSSEAIRREIDALPSMPLGDLTPHLEVVSARRAYDRALQAIELHEQGRPAEPHVTDAKGLTADQLRELARALETSIPSPDPGLETRYKEDRRRLEAVEHSSFSRPLVAGLAAAAVLGGAGLWVLHSPWIGSALLIAGVVALVWLIFRSGEAGRTHALEELRVVEAQVLAQRKAMDEARAQVTAARSQIARSGLPVDSKALRQLADEIVLVGRNLQAVGEWSTSNEALRFSMNAAIDVLRQALTQRGIGEVNDFIEGYDEYERACLLRAEQSVGASTRPRLEQQLAARESAERAVSDAAVRRLAAEQRILATLARCGLEAHGVTAIEELRRWQAARREMLIHFEDAAREYAELQALLAGGTLEDLESQTAERQRRGASLAAEFVRLPEVANGGELDDEIKRSDRVAHDASHAATTAEAQGGERARDIPSVAEAEESLVRARVELARVTRLSTTLSLTLDFLRAAEDRVHRNIAPLLAEALRQWLPDVTQGRYTDARIDPSDLCVQVLGPDHEWRDTRLLSHGTAEQIYLLLRVVLAEHLATTGETCPLILDDVLVQCDRTRKRALLSVILTVSSARQVILLTQEQEVLQWAQENVVLPNRLVVLPGPPILERTT
jgi:exonuclease SbcC